MAQIKIIAIAETIIKTVTAKDKEDRLHPVSSLISGRIKPKADSIPALKNRTIKPVPRTTQLLFIIYFHKKFRCKNKT